MPQTTTKPPKQTFRRLIDLSSAITADDKGNVQLPEEIEMLVEGQWDTPYHGYFQVSRDDLSEYKQHFDAGIRKGVPIDLEHNTIGGAAAWIESVEVKASSADPMKMALWGKADWTDKGEQALKSREYRFFSPEFCDHGYEDPETGDFYNNVLIGGGLTNRPLFKKLQALRASDTNGGGDDKLTTDQRNNIIYLSEENAMQLKDLLEKKPADLTADEAKFVKEHQSELTDEQKTAFADVLKDSDDDKDKDDKKDKQDDKDKSDKKDKDAADDDDADDDASKQASDKGKKGVTISASELKQLREDAKAGKQASEELAAKKASDHIQGKAFSDKGMKLPIAAKDSVTEFYLTLNKNQRQAFDKIVDSLPKSKMFYDLSSTKPANGGEGTALEQVRKKANDLIDDAKKKKQAGDKVVVPTYGQAVSKVLASDSDLKQRYNEENEGDK